MAGFDSRIRQAYAANPDIDSDVLFRAAKREARTESRLATSDAMAVSNDWLDLRKPSVNERR
jgi:hypothetical protein